MYIYMYIIIEQHTAAAAAVTAAASRLAWSAAPWPGRPGADQTCQGAAAATAAAAAVCCSMIVYIYKYIYYE